MAEEGLTPEQPEYMNAFPNAEINPSDVILPSGARLRAEKLKPDQQEVAGDSSHNNNSKSDSK